MLKYAAVVTLLFHLSTATPSSGTTTGEPSPSTAASETSGTGGQQEVIGPVLEIKRGRYPAYRLSPPKPSPLTSEDTNEILDFHNTARRAEPALEMPDLVWNASLASIAQEWTDACTFAHQPRRVRRWGENIAAVGNTRTKSTQISTMLSQWAGEKEFSKNGTVECCNFTQNSCCHYTQIIWDRTTSIGCGYSECAFLSYGDSMMRDIAYLACYYAPPGNNPVVTYDWRPYIPAPSTP